MKYIFHVRTDEGLDKEQVDAHLQAFRDEVDKKDFFEAHDKVLYISDKNQTYIETVCSDY